MMSGSKSMKKAMKTELQKMPQLFSSESETEEEEEEEDMMLRPPVTWGGGMRKKVLSKQLSMRETKRELKWEKRRRQMYRRSRSQKIDGVMDEKDGKQGNEEEMRAKGRARVRSLTDEDLDELRGSIELGFGFDEENGGYDLCKTLPALNLYFAVNRQLSDPKLRLSPSPASTPTASTSTLYGTPSPRSPLLEQQGSYAGGSENTWKIFKPGDSPQHVKTRLRHWAQIVACSVRQCC